MARKRQEVTSLGDVLKEVVTGLQSSVHTPNILAYKPHAKQERFHKSQKKIRLYIGGNRSGKTTGGITEDIWWLTRKHPYYELPSWDLRGRIISVDFLNGITNIIIPQLSQWLPASELINGSWEDSYHKAEKTLTLANGSSVELMSYDQDLDKFAGTSRDFIHYDEEPPQNIYTECQARLIDRKGRSWLTMTPVEGMTWVFDVLYEPGINSDHRLIDVIEVGMEENPYLDRTEISDYLDSLNEDEREARGKGKFVQMGGLVYKKFRPEIHIIDPVDPKRFSSPNFKQYMSLDHGYNNPTAVHWHAVDKNNHAITFDEHYEREQTVDYHSMVINERNNLHKRVPDINVADPAIAQRQGVTGTSIQTEYAIRGIGFALGNNDVLTGVTKVNQYLDFNEFKRPQWHITANCGNLIREIAKLRWKTWANKKQQYQNNPYEQIHKKDDHACDSCRYFFTLMPDLSPMERKQEKTELPNIGGNSAVSSTKYRIDPNLTPKGLTKKTDWRVSLNEED